MFWNHLEETQMMEPTTKMAFFFAGIEWKWHIERAPVQIEFYRYCRRVRWAAQVFVCSCWFVWMDISLLSMQTLWMCSAFDLINWKSNQLIHYYLYVCAGQFSRNQWSMNFDWIDFMHFSRPNSETRLNRVGTLKSFSVWWKKNWRRVRAKERARNRNWRKHTRPTESELWGYTKFSILSFQRNSIYRLRTNDFYTMFRSTWSPLIP